MVKVSTKKLSRGTYHIKFRQEVFDFSKEFPTMDTFSFEKSLTLRFVFDLSDKKIIHQNYNLVNFCSDIGGIYVFIFIMIVKPISSAVASKSLTNYLINSNLEYISEPMRRKFDALDLRRRFKLSFCSMKTKMKSRAEKRISSYFDV